MAYVYIITNIINKKKYVGSSRKPQIDENYYGSGKLIKKAIDKYGINDQVSYTSTGGGAFLEFLEGKELPAVAVLKSRH